ncbi:MAG: response regulator [Chthoniobacteraceae bacterium]
MDTPIHILIVEDSEDDAALLVAELKDAGFDPTWKRVETEEEYMAQLKTPPEMILSDFTMPHFNGLRAARLLRETGSEVPFILVSGTLGEERVVEGFKAGATDYVVKSRLERLGQVVRRALGEVNERTERKKFEKQFIEAQKMEVIGMLASGVAHDFNNFLAVIMGYGELIVDKLKADDPLQEYAGEILQAAERSAALTRQLLIFSSKQPVKAVVLDLNRVIWETEKMLRRLVDENIEMTILPGEGIGSMKADTGHIGQVLMNLVVNARDAMPHGGKLTIETSNATLDGDDAGSHAGMTPGNYVLLAIRDTGTGMTAEVKAHLFEAFFTTKPKGKGTGLGLATCQTIVKQCGGHIALESEEGKGTTFQIYFPRVDQATEFPLLPPTMAVQSPGTETIMVVEDEPAVRQLASSILEWQGYRVLRANNGEDGLRIAKEYKDGPIGLVVTDVIMPLMGGKAMAGWLKEANPEIKILFTSGYTDDAIASHGGLDAGVAFLPKPYLPATLTRMVRELLDGKDKMASQA